VGADTKRVAWKRQKGVRGSLQRWPALRSTAEKGDLQVGNDPEEAQGLQANRTAATDHPTRWAANGSGACRCLGRAKDRTGASSTPYKRKEHAPALPEPPLTPRIPSEPQPRPSPLTPLRQARQPRQFQSKSIQRFASIPWQDGLAAIRNGEIGGVGRR